MTRPTMAQAASRYPWSNALTLMRRVRPRATTAGTMASRGPAARLGRIILRPSKRVRLRRRNMLTRPAENESGLLGWTRTTRSLMATRRRLLAVAATHPALGTAVAHQLRPEARVSTSLAVAWGRRRCHQPWLTRPSRRCLQQISLVSRLLWRLREWQRALLAGHQRC